MNESGASVYSASEITGAEFPDQDMTVRGPVSISDLMKQAAIREKIEISAYVTDSIGLPTLKDILGELAKPGRDPREEFEAFAFAGGIEAMQDLRPGMNRRSEK